MSVLEFKRPLPRPKTKPKSEDYACSICFADLFTLRSDGIVLCGKCHIRIGNLFVEDTNGRRDR
jgi:hypothetical protein